MTSPTDDLPSPGQQPITAIPSTLSSRSSSTNDFHDSYELVSTPHGPADNSAPRSATATPMPEPEAKPTYRGHVASTYDALVIIEACLSGILYHLGRRPRDSERSALVKSGNVFVYESRSSGIARWDDGVKWSESITVGNFKLYRQLSRGSGSSWTNGIYDSKGLCKRTLNVEIRGVTHHLVAYFRIKDIASGALILPSLDQGLAGLSPRSELMHQGFRRPIDRDDVEEIFDAASL